MRCGDAGRRDRAPGGTYVAWRVRSFRRSRNRTATARRASTYRQTNLQEAKLAREAEICYTTLALVTDYDCWHPDHDSVTVDMIIANLTQNAKTAQQVIANAVERLPIARDCECARALATALITRPEAVPGRPKATVRSPWAPVQVAKASAQRCHV
jgi:5'-methylthioadenosine phosphorylase